LKAFLGEISAQDLFGYLAGILGSPSYQEKFAADLVAPGPRIPITKDTELFARVAGIGRRFVWFQTGGERWGPQDAVARGLPDFGIRVEIRIPRSAAEYPEDFSYDAATQSLRVGGGVVGGVTPEVWAYEQSRWQVVPHWLGYRMKVRAGRAGESGSSPLDSIRPVEWTFTEDLLRLLRQVHGCVSLWGEMAVALEEVTASDCFSSGELPEASAPDDQTEPASAEERMF
jgi:Type ISP C-terminal specificity domain